MTHEPTTFYHLGLWPMYLIAEYGERAENENPAQRGDDRDFFDTLSRIVTERIQLANPRRLSTFYDLSPETQSLISAYVMPPGYIYEPHSHIDLAFGETVTTVIATKNAARRALFEMIKNGSEDRWQIMQIRQQLRITWHEIGTGMQRPSEYRSDLLAVLNGPTIQFPPEQIAYMDFSRSECERCDRTVAFVAQQNLSLYLDRAIEELSNITDRRAWKLLFWNFKNLLAFGMQPSLETYVKAIDSPHAVLFLRELLKTKTLPNAQYMTTIICNFRIFNWKQLTEVFKERGAEFNRIHTLLIALRDREMTLSSQFLASADIAVALRAHADEVGISMQAAIVQHMIKEIVRLYSVEEQGRIMMEMTIMMSCMFPPHENHHCMNLLKSFDLRLAQRWSEACLLYLVASQTPSPEHVSAFLTTGYEPTVELVEKALAPLLNQGVLTPAEIVNRSKLLEMATLLYNAMCDEKKKSEVWDRLETASALQMSLNS